MLSYFLQYYFLCHLYVRSRMSNTNDSVCQFPNVGDSENLAPRATYIIGFEPSVDVNSLALGVRNILARGNPDNPPLQSLHMAISELTEDEYVAYVQLLYSG